MATIRYRIVDGLPPFEVRLYDGAILIDTNYHAIIGDYYFTNLPDGTYTIRIIDATGCFIEFNSIIDCITTTSTTSEPTTTTTTTTLNIELICNIGVELGTEYDEIIEPQQVFYRNYEADNTLALADYVGRENAIQTPIQFVEGTVDYVILENVPYFSDLYGGVTQIGLQNVSVYIHPDNNLRKVSSVELLGTYLGHANCVKFYTTAQSSGTAGDKYIIYNIYPTGIWVNSTKLIPRNTGDWNATMMVGACSIWQYGGVYNTLVTGYNSSSPIPVKIHLFTANTLDGAWTDQTGASNSVFDSSCLPGSYIGVNSVVGHIDLGDGLHAGATILYETGFSLDAPGIVIWNEDLSYKTGFNITTDYTFSLGFTAYVSLTFYKNQYYYSVHDGTARTGQRQVLVSDCLSGTYSYHSTIMDFDDTIYNTNSGLVWDGSFANGVLFTFGNRLYFASSGQNEASAFAGEWGNHCINFWLYDDNTNTWDILVSPVLTSQHSTTLFGWTWGWDHTGYMDAFYIEDDKLWWFCAFNQLTDTYEVTNGYFDLNTLFATTTSTTTGEPGPTTTSTTGEPGTTTTSTTGETTSTTTTTIQNNLKSGLLSVWEFDEESGTTSYDSHGDNDLTITGATINQTGKINKAYSFDGSADWVYSSSNIITSLPLTISFWIKVSSSGVNRISTNWYSSVYYGVEVGFDYNQLVVAFYDGTGTGTADRKTYTAANSTSSGTWYHIVVVFNSFDNFDYYVDNVEKTLTYKSGTASSLSFGDGVLYIGRVAASTTYSPVGTIDQVAVWNRALAEDEIETLYNSGNGLTYTEWDNITTTTSTTNEPTTTTTTTVI